VSPNYLTISDFQSFDHTQYDPNQYAQSPYPNQPNIFTPQAIATPDDFSAQQTANEFDEPPLLDELEIYPSRILEKSLAVLNPFHKKGVADDPEYLFLETDIAGPIAFCLGMAACLFVSGNKAQFGYVYGLSIMSVLVMFTLISLMCNTTQNYVTISAVASILGYSILPIVWLSIIGVFFSLNTHIGMVLAGAAILLATAAASRVFCLMTGDPHQRFLIAYPCALVYVIFALLVLF
jgi:protein YIPF5/7